MKESCKFASKCQSRCFYRTIFHSGRDSELTIPDSSALKRVLNVSVANARQQIHLLNLWSTNFFTLVFTDTVPSSHETCCILTVRTDCLMRYMVTFPSRSDINMKHINTLPWISAGVLTLKQTVYIKCVPKIMMGFQIIRFLFLGVCKANRV